MTTLEVKAYQNIRRWRNLSLAEQKAIGHRSVISHVKNSMAMEGEPVSKAWLKRNAR